MNFDRRYSLTLAFFVGAAAALAAPIQAFGQELEIKGQQRLTRDNPSTKTNGVGGTWFHRWTYELEPGKTYQWNYRSVRFEPSVRWAVNDPANSSTEIKAVQRVHPVTGQQFWEIDTGPVTVGQPTTIYFTVHGPAPIDPASNGPGNYLMRYSQR